MFFDVLLWILIIIIGCFATVGVFTLFSIFIDDDPQETDENGEEMV